MRSWYPAISSKSISPPSLFTIILSYTTLTNCYIRRQYQTIHEYNIDDKKLSAAIKKLNMQPIAGVDEVNIFLNNGQIIHFNKPKIQAMVPNVFVVSGNAEEKAMTDLLPTILDQLGPESIERLKKLAEQMGAFNQCEC